MTIGAIAQLWAIAAFIVGLLIIVVSVVILRSGNPQERREEL